MAGGKGYAKVFRRIWTDEKFRKLDPIGKLVALYALTSQSNRIGLFRFSRALAAEETGLSRDRLDTVWGTVCHTLSWGWDEGVGTVFLPSWWKWNPPDNASAFQGYMADLDDLPDSPLIARFASNLRHLPDTLHHTVSDTVSHRVSHTVSPPEPYPEPEHKPEPEIESPPRATHAAPKGGAFLRPPFGDVQAYCQERALAGHRRVDPQAWFDHYEANGWRVGKNPMKEWRAAVRTWERNDHGNGNGKPASGKMDARQIREFRLTREGKL